MRGRGTWARRLLGLAACLALVVAGCSDSATEPIEHGVTRVRVALFPGGSTLPACSCHEWDMRPQWLAGRGH